MRRCLGNEGLERVRISDAATPLGFAVILRVLGLMDALRVIQGMQVTEPPALTRGSLP
jgi:hypothetical protein